MTTRQQEFVRHYLLGKPAKEAAMAAGYATLTAERNAAEMLRHPSVASAIERIRRDAVFTRQDLIRAKAELDHIIRYVQDDRLKLRAMDKLERLARLEKTLPIIEIQPILNQTPINADENSL